MNKKRNSSRIKVSSFAALTVLLILSISSTLIEMTRATGGREDEKNNISSSLRPRNTSNMFIRSGSAGTTSRVRKLILEEQQVHEEEQQEEYKSRRLLELKNSLDDKSNDSKQEKSEDNDVVVLGKQEQYHPVVTRKLGMKKARVHKVRKKRTNDRRISSYKKSYK